MEGKSYTHSHTEHAQLPKASRSSRENFSISVYVSIASFPFQQGLSLSLLPQGVPQWGCLQAGELSVTLNRQ